MLERKGESMTSELLVSKERMIGLDVIRGFAVLGIFFVNVPEMIGIGNAFEPSYRGLDAFIRLIYDMLFQTKFYSIFAFLFGVGFYLFFENAERQGKRPRILFMRRLLLLMVLGIGHAVLLWFGDILYTYAILGFLLLIFYKRSPKTILVWSLILSGLFGLFIILATFALGLSKELSKPLFTHIPDWGERIDFLLGSGLGNAASLSFEILGLFLLGLYAGKKSWFEHKELNVTVVHRVHMSAFILSILLFIPMVHYYSSHPVYMPMELYPYTHFTGKTMAIFYICTLLLMIHRYGIQRFSSLAAVGRMTLTNYLVQSILTMLLLQVFWNYVNRLPLWVGMVYSVAVVVIIIFWSKLWLHHYRMGPLEWLWRAGTYGQWPALNRKQGVATGGTPTTKA
ncbi:DUF418 domain-containing protein [Paenibacillus sp. LMG 31456]|uniref:DUF418 domain-containing protein n=1 Tax=Paenibacillus foliorum TaxID=2654974 RepID=A0A972GY01_9BACL|nr:DUF418 domain-containing protein [Paenibacillus foliorum]NOU92611.1 DUF418 domain-containing protein [Paenibacillus foliorum]